MAIIMYLKICATDYISVVYKSATGYVVMAVVLVVYIGTLYVTERMKQKILYVD